MAAAAKRQPISAAPLSVASIFPNPDQPRTVFDDAYIAELWASIASEGLLQPITVTPRDGPDGARFMLVAGECRWRAHVHGGAKVIEANIRYDLDDATVMVLAILENARRRDVTPLEEAVAYQKCLDRGMTPEELCTRLGLKQVWRITERTCLLTLRPEYQALLRSKQLGKSEAYEMAQLEPAGQDALFKLIRTGQCPDYNALRAAAAAVQESLQVVELFGAMDDKPSESDKRLARGLESRFTQLIKVLRASTVDNEVVAVRKIAPDRAGTLADLCAAARGDLLRIETALRLAPQMELAANG